MYRVSSSPAHCWAWISLARQLSYYWLHIIFYLSPIWRMWVQPKLHSYFLTGTRDFLQGAPCWQYLRWFSQLYMYNMITFDIWIMSWRWSSQYTVLVEINLGPFLPQCSFGELPWCRCRAGDVYLPWGKLKKKKSISIISLQKESYFSLRNKPYC